MEFFRLAQKFDVMIDTYTKPSLTLLKEGKRARTKLQISNCNSDHVAYTVLRGFLHFAFVATESLLTVREKTP
jgi:hypothetical protein